MVFRRPNDRFIETHDLKQSGSAEIIIDEELVSSVKEFVNSQLQEKRFV